MLSNWNSTTNCRCNTEHIKETEMIKGAIIALVSFIFGYLTANTAIETADDDEEWKHYGPDDLFDNEEPERLE